LPSTAPATLRTLLNSTDSRGSDRVDYLRGVRTGEGADASTFRQRSTALGDIVNSNVWYLGAPQTGSKLGGYGAFVTANVSRKPMIYVGANDGMLHGFSAAPAGTGSDAGQELMAYVPLGAYPNLTNYTKQNYTHHYSVDGSPFSGDVKLGSTSWKTYLAGFMGAGGRGYFILDVTSPGNFSESNASTLVVLDNTDETVAHADVGNLLPQPSKDPAYDSRAVQFTMMNDNRPALILGNGVNSPNERPVLLIQYLDGAKELVRLVASSTTGQGNGLMNPQIIDLNGDGKADLVYAGDLLGNLWRFDVSSSNATTWNVSFNSNPLFSAKDSGGSFQPIVAAPVWLPHPKGGLMLGVSTGRTLSSGDRTDTSEQSIYGIWDKSKLTISNGSVTIENDATKRITDGRTSLVQEVMGTSTVATYAGKSFYDYTPTKVNYETTGTNPNRRGWYMNFTDSGERGSSNPYWFSGNYVVVPSNIPASGTDTNTETCSATSKAEVGFLTIVDLISGSGPKKPVFDTNGGGMTGNEVKASKIKGLGDSVTFSIGNKLVAFDGKTKDGTSMDPGIDGGVTTGWRER
jgi:type IV pilus assembly protein PilY1